MNATMVRAGREATTLASRAYFLVRQEIMDGTLPPASRIHIAALAKRLEVGASPLREALNRLVSEKLVLQIDQRGFRTAPLLVEELDQLSLASGWVHSAAVRASVQRGDDSWEEALVVAHHRLRKLSRAEVEGDPGAWPAAYRRLNIVLVSACGSQIMEDFCHEVFERVSRYRQICYRRTSRLLAPDYTLVVEAALARDPELAAERMTDHIRDSVDRIRAAMKEGAKS